ncbi:MAG: leucine--tRNA ligase, partial [Nanoarchaeota archaeon]|nr:leucine--tRNA ligase [Nanoarchaeota archaeon]
MFEKKESLVSESKPRDDIVYFHSIEKKWQKKWAEAKIFESEAAPGKPKFFANFPYPYMNGKLHIGHLYTFLRAEIFSRYKRMRGYNVLFPFAFHCTGTPIVAAARRIKDKEEKQVKILKDMNIPDSELKKFENPLYWIEYFPKAAKSDLQSLGAAIDWRRSFRTTEVNPPYSKFIEWQFNKLKEKNYVVRGEHPVAWCPKDKMATGDHDRIQGEGVVPEEMTLVKFEIDGKILPAATYRPETTFGVTNMWLNPDAVYVEVRVDKETWIVTKETLEKLKDQNHAVSVIKEIKGKEFVGKFCINIATCVSVPILPAVFVDPKIGTGVVMSVPGHAPYDYIALRDIQRAPEKYGMKVEQVSQIKPISLIKVEGFGDFPAVEIAGSMKIEGQSDEKLEEATKTIYKKEFHGGILKDITGKYKGMTVAKAKDIIISDFKKVGAAVSFYELPEAVVCRCLSPCHVKIIDDQWFMKYSDAGWKAKTHKALDNMNLCPDESRAQFNYVIDWLNDWACSREFGLGTRIPWDKKWLIESLSDSTIYMAYYTIAHIIQSEKIDASKSYDILFDYVFLGKGTAASAEKDSGINVEKIEKMRCEFLYWYPFDFRNSAKDLVGNHLTFSLFNHTAIFDEKFWPKGFGVNGYVTVEGEKMSKSKGNFYTMEEILVKYGADVSRITDMMGGEGLDDANWDSRLADTFSKKLFSIKEMALSIADRKKKKGKGAENSGHIDRWLVSQVHRQIKLATVVMDETKFRSALMASYYDMQAALKWYERRAENTNTDAAAFFIDAQLKMLAPFTPHICEELWSELGKKGFISAAEWPEFDAKKIDENAEKMEALIKQTLEDVNAIKKIVKKDAKQINIYVPEIWKYDMYALALTKPKNLIAEAMKNTEIKKQSEAAVKFAQQLAKNMNVLEKTLSKEDEIIALKSAEKFFAKEFGCAVSVI